MEGADGRVPVGHRRGEGRPRRERFVEMDDVESLRGERLQGPEHGRRVRGERSNRAVRRRRQRIAEGCDEALGRWPVTRPEDSRFETS